MYGDGRKYILYTLQIASAIWSLLYGDGMLVSPSSLYLHPCGLIIICISVAPCVLYMMDVRTSCMLYAHYACMLCVLCTSIMQAGGACMMDVHQKNTPYELCSSKKYPLWAQYFAPNLWFGANLGQFRDIFDAIASWIDIYFAPFRA